MQAQLLQRYIWLVSTIQSAGYITKEEIDRRWASSVLNDTHEWEYNRRSFIRHKDDIAQVFQIEIAYAPRKGYYIETSMNPRGDQLRNWLMNNFAVSNALTESQQIRERVLLEKIPSGAEHLLPIIAAMRNGHQVQMTYRKFGGQDQVFDLEPYCLRVFKQRWYVYGVPSSHPGERRIYALDRVIRIDELDKKYVLPEDFDAEIEFAHYYGAFTDRPAERIVVRVNDRGRDYMSSLPLHDSQKELVRTDEYSEFEFYISPTFDFVQQLRTYGSQLLVLEPQWLRDDMQAEVQKLARLYETGDFPTQMSAAMPESQIRKK